VRSIQPEAIFTEAGRGVDASLVGSQKEGQVRLNGSRVAGP
jgi:hypothetical protein